MKQTVQLSHLDTKGYLGLGALVNLMQDCSFNALDKQKELKEYLVEHHVGAFLSSRQLEIKRIPILGETIEIRASMYKCNPIYCHRNVMVYDENGEILVASNAISFFVNMKDLHVSRIPKSVLDTIQLYPPHEMDYQPRKVLLPLSVVPKEKDRMFVWRFLLDANQHINNAKYLSMAQEFIPIDFPIKRVRVEYQHAAHYGAYIYPKVYEMPNGYVVNLESHEGKHYAIVEFSC